MTFSARMVTPGRYATVCSGSDLPTDGGRPDPRADAAIAARHGLEFDFESIPELIEGHWVTFGPAAPGPSAT
jgi:hypothetical protein